MVHISRHFFLYFSPFRGTVLISKFAYDECFGIPKYHFIAFAICVINVTNKTKRGEVHRMEEIGDISPYQSIQNTPTLHIGIYIRLCTVENMDQFQPHFGRFSKMQF